MKITATQYAKSLYELTAGKNQSEIDAIIANFMKVLAKNRQHKLMPKVIEKFSEIYNQKNGIVESEVATARQLEDSQLHKVESFIREKYSAKKVIVNNRIDLNIRGGIVIKVKDEVLDASIAKSLAELKKVLIN